MFLFFFHSLPTSAVIMLCNDGYSYYHHHRSILSSSQLLSLCKFARRREKTIWESKMRRILNFSCIHSIEKSSYSQLHVQMRVCKKWSNSNELRSTLMASIKIISIQSYRHFRLYIKATQYRILQIFPLNFVHINWGSYSFAYIYSWKY